MRMAFINAVHGNLVVAVNNDTGGGPLFSALKGSHDYRT